MREPLRPGDRVTIEENGVVKRAFVRGLLATIAYRGRRWHVDLPDENVAATFSSTAASSNLQQLRWTDLFEDEENKTWVRGWMDAEEMKALIVAEALS